MRSYGTRAHNRFFPPTNRPKWGEEYKKFSSWRDVWWVEIKINYTFYVPSERLVLSNMQLRNN